MNRTPYRFMLRVVVVMFPVLLSLSLIEAFLWRAGETVPVRWLARRHDRTGPPAAYMPWFIGQQFSLLHYERMRHQRPELLVLGSSHVTRFRQEMFGPGAGFYNAGRTIVRMGDLEDVLHTLPADYAPRTLLLGVDYWWFNANMDQTGQFAKELDQDQALLVEAHFNAVSKLVYGLRRDWFTTDLLRRVVVGDDQGVARYGMVAWASAGIRNDGSNQNFDRSTPSAYIPSLPSGLREIKAFNHPMFRSAVAMDEALMARFVAALKEFERRGTRIVGFAPPYASEVHQLFERYPGYFGIYHDFRQRLAGVFHQHGWLFAEKSDLASLGLDDRYMRDYDHAQETYHVVLLREMARTPAFRQALHLDPEYLTALLDDPRASPWYPVFDRRRNSLAHAQSP